MNTLSIVDEFRIEADKALFTAEQALKIAHQLLEKERQSGNHSEKEVAQLTDAVNKMNIHYIDMTATETDKMLDEMSVARLTAQDIVTAIDNVLFDVSM